MKKHHERRYDSEHRYPYTGLVEEDLRVGLYRNGITVTQGPWFVAKQSPDQNWDYRSPTASEYDRIVIVGWVGDGLGGERPDYRLRLPECVPC